MSDAQTQQSTPASTPAGPKYPAPTDQEGKRALRRHLRKKGREKLMAKIQTDKEFSKTYFEARSKRSTDKKSAFRKKKSKKK